MLPVAGTDTTRTVLDKDPVTHFDVNTQKLPILHDMRCYTNVISPIYFLRNYNYTDIEMYRCITQQHSITIDRTLHTKWHGYELPLAKMHTPTTTSLHSRVDILHS